MGYYIAEETGFQRHTWVWRHDDAFAGIFVAHTGIFVVVVLLFYVHGKHLRSCRDGQLT